MKHITLIALALITFLSCENSKDSGKRIVPSSSGTLNNISVVVDNDLWKGSVGEAIRDVLASPVHGLPQDEPMFSMNQIPPQVFTGFVTKNRTVLKIETGGETGVSTATDAYAKPQKVVVVSGKTKEDIIKAIKDNSKKIIAAFKDEELKEKQRRISLSLFDDKDLKEKLNVSLKFPTAYRIAKQDDNFFWIRKDITTGTTNLMVYTLPKNNLIKDSTLVNQVVKIRDSIGKKYIEGTLEGSYMGTEDAYAPYIKETILDNKPAIETKGIWDMKNGTVMAGPFVNYVIEDNTNDRLVVVEGFAFAPSVSKRDYMFELEAIIRSIKIE